jgi:hypothetical protein
VFIAACDPRRRGTAWLAGGRHVPAHRFHPEFGYFCPSPSLRRKLRIVVACIVIGVIAGASGALVLKAATIPIPAAS